MARSRVSIKRMSGTLTNVLNTKRMNLYDRKIHNLTSLKAVIMEINPTVLSVAE